MRQLPNCDDRSKLAARRQDIIRNFIYREDGSLVVFALFLIPMMLILGGMAVDFMRYEGKRAVIQDTADRAALLAANLEFTNVGEGAAVVEDYFAKAGLDEYLDGPAIVTESINNRTVEVNVAQPMNTFFLNMVGIDQIDASAHSVATQGVGNVEISLVLDISGSMRNATKDADGNATGLTKMEAMKAAATTFVNTALQDSNQDRVSLSLVPYSEHVNIGRTLFDRLNTDQKHNFSHCIDFDDADFGVSGIDAGRTYSQGQHIDHWSTGSTMHSPNCPSESYEQVTAVSQDRAALVAQIAQFQPTTQTSIFLGMKWGLALLDPSTKALVSPDVDGAFAGRPVAFTTDTETNDTRKVLVIMTDGQNTESTRVKPEMYTEPSHFAHWGQRPVRNWRDNNLFTSKHSWSEYTEQHYTNSEGNALLAASCDAAREANVQVFAIAFEAGSNGEQVMANCATTVNHYFNTNGDDLNAVFRAIAEQVTDLRLTQ
ncbi:MAG: pilus assembly protein TadG-related protein [Yoonia sp.]|uniref:pilus assembly protein n=1 Tax=Yoonia sp. TaxID=2212373 RepID=UPI00326637F3